MATGDGLGRFADYQRAPRRTSDRSETDAWEQLGERLYNVIITRIPAHWLRLFWLRLFGAKIGKRTSVLMNTRVLGLKQLSIGDSCSIGARCLLDARAGLTIDDAVVMERGVQLISGHHVVDSNDFGNCYSPVHVAHHAWIATGALVLDGVDIGPGAVVGACSLVRADVAPMTVVAGVPAKRIGDRTSRLDYDPAVRPLFC